MRQFSVLCLVTSVLSVHTLLPLAMAEQAGPVAASILSSSSDNASIVGASDHLLRGGVSETDTTQPISPTVNANDLKTVLPGETLEMTISTSMETGLSTQGDEFFGKLTRPVTVDGKVVLPRDTIVHGMIQEIAPARRAGRNAYVTTRFDYLITPDGREIPIQGGYTNHDSKAMAAAKVVGRSAGYTAVGGVIGAVTVLRMVGIAGVAASHGYALAGGAAVGGALGLGVALATKGHSLWIPSGTNMQVKLKEKLVLPSMNVASESSHDVMLTGLTVKVNQIKVGKDPFGEPTELTMSVDMTNATDNTFTMFDIALEDENGNLFYPSAFGDTGLWFEKLQPRTHLSGNLTFNVDNPKLRHTLIFYKQYTREPLTRIALSDVMMKTKAH